MAKREPTPASAADTVPADEDALLDEPAPPPVEQAWKSTTQLPAAAPLEGDGPEAAAFALADGATAPAYPSHQRILVAFLAARASLAGLLCAVEITLALLAATPPAWPVLGLSLIYALATVGLLLWPGRAALTEAIYSQHQRRWYLATTGVDLLVFSLLLPASSAGLNFAALFALPVLMSALLQGRRAALGTAATVAFILLGHAWWQVLRGAELALTFTQAGLTSAAMFAVGLLANELASRLAAQEAEARSTLDLARQQATLNRLVIEEMQEGVMVVDRAGRVRAANPAALDLLDAPVRERPVSFGLGDQSTWRDLRQAVDLAYVTGEWPAEGREVSVATPRGPQQERRLRLRMRFTRRRDRAQREPLCVLFVEDQRVVQTRARQEKLAAMGRVSAGIAHEIRNPLAAISQANALLTEDLQDPGLRQLARIVSDNVERLRRIVDDVLAVAPGGLGKGHVDAAPIDIAPLVRSICADWTSTQHPPPPGGLIRIEVSEEPDLRGCFDAEHLRRVLINLLENAWRHGSRSAQAIWVKLGSQGLDALRLSVASDGAPIRAEVERHLFEPFFSTRSRGAGLGLYICRELCERNRAQIEYQARGPESRHRNVFVILMPRQPQAASRRR